MKRALPIASLAAGLLTSQVIATLQVYASNQALHRRLLLIIQDGYLAIPSQAVMPMLQGIRAPLLGGLFFTFSVGLGLCLLTLIGWWLWERLLGRSRVWLLLLLLAWLLGLILVNLAGFNAWATVYFILVPGVMALLLGLQRPAAGADHSAFLATATWLVPVFVLIAAWSARTGPDGFIRLRDAVLLSNPVGVAVNDFYYRYTMYPAEAFRPLAQKSIKTVSLTAIEDEAVKIKLTSLLLPHDYLPVDGNGPIDLGIAAEKQTLRLENQGRVVLRVGQVEFFNNPAKVLAQFSAKVDTNLFFRSLTSLALALCVPVALFSLIVFPLRLGFRLVLPASSAPFVASGLAMALGLAVIIFGAGGRSRPPDHALLAQMLRSERAGDRIEALRYSAGSGIEVADLADYRPMLASPSIPVRYWLAKALGASHRPEAYSDLLALLGDPHPNVVCMALSSLGRLGEKRAVAEILKRIESSGHWYEQWYGYQALKVLGWKQGTNYGIIMQQLVIPDSN